MSKLRLIVTTAAAAGLLAAAAATPAMAKPPSRSTDITYTNAQLDKARTTLDQRLTKPAAGIASWGVDPASGRVTLDVVKTDAKALVQAKAAIKDLPQAKIRLVDEAPRPFYNVVGGQAIYAANGGRCSVGFSARNSSGATFVITAGHCTELGGTWSGYNRVIIGPARTANFPADDFGTIQVSNTSWVPTSQVSGTSSVLGATAAAVGASTCRSGSTTGYRCGTIQAKNQTVNYGGGDIVSGLTRTSACAEPGDSGGSFVSGRQAQGVTSGGSGNCTSGGTTFFQPIGEILSRNSLTLVTG